jgi:DNA-binding winged helix-turn-helix (wHTH) protein/TolB-like protein/Flp pilus assembly protein TadD
MSGSFEVSADNARADERGRKRLQIGEWSADPEADELTRGTETVRIEPKAMDVLMLLADRVGRVVSREELLVAVWPGVVVGDEALTQSIIKLRKALGDNSRSPSYIETIAKRGYRLIAPVRQSEAVAATPAEATLAGARPAELDQALPAQRPPASPRYLRSAALTAVVALAAALFGLYFFRSIPHTPAAADEVEVEDSRQAGWVGVTIVPFESLGADRAQAYFARGISDNLVTDLSRLSGLRLIRESDVGPTAPSARYRISGSVQRESAMLRINIHLVDTKTHEQLWSERFERPFGDLFAVQDEITAKLVELLPAKVSDAERQRVAKRHTRSLEAYDYFLRAQALFLVRRSEENEEARALYRKAVELDPEFARAYAGLAMTYAMDYRLRQSTYRSPALDRAHELAETARLIDPDIPEIYWALGFVQAQSRHHEQARESLQKAIALDRSFADAYALLGGILTYQGQPARSIPLLRTAMRFNPDGGYLYFLLLGRAYLFVGDTEQALINLRAALMRNPADVETRVYLAAALAAAGDHLAAKWEGDEIRSLEPGFSMRYWLETYPMTSAQQRQRLSTLLAELNL